MSHDHEPPRTASRQVRRRLSIVLALTVVYLAVEAAGSWYTGSLALLAEAGHMLTDAGGLALALFAMALAERPATPQQTYGYYRAEILAAAVNAMALFGISLFVLVEAFQRVRHPEPVESPVMVGIATVGLAVNLTALSLLRASSTKNLNVRAAYFEVVADAATAAGVIVAGVVMWATRWYYADALLSGGIALFILPRTWKLLKEAVGVLLEGTPADVSLAELRKALSEIEGVAGVHDLHVWALTSGVNALSAHVVRTPGSSHDGVLEAVHRGIEGHFKIAHVTIQVESEGCEEGETHL